MITKIRVAVVGYGNIGKYVVECISHSPDIELVGIIRRKVDNVPDELKHHKLVESILELTNIDVAILCLPSRKVEEVAKECLELGINTVDSFDIHSEIFNLQQILTPIAKQNNSVSIISAGWDPGSDSIIRTLMQAMAPQGITYTNFGPGMSMGHTVAAKAIRGVTNALSITIPEGAGVHKRMVYVELEKGYDLEEVAKSIKKDAYFIDDQTHVYEVSDIESLKDMGHGVDMSRKGSSGKTQNQLFHFKMNINNPALTAQMMVNAARATLRQAPGAYTLIEIPVIDLLPGDKGEWIKKLV